MNKPTIDKTTKTMIETFQCPGCVLGHNTKCGEFNLQRLGLSSNDPVTCASHFPGTRIMRLGLILLGLPKGFCRIKNEDTKVRLFDDDKKFQYDHFNVPVWAMEIEENGTQYLLVRCYQPRIDASTIDVWRGKLLRDLPMNPINVAEFVDDID